MAQKGIKDHIDAISPKDVTRHLEKESDRGVVLILAAYLEEILGLIVRSGCVSDKLADDILKHGSPAGDFESRMVLAQALGWIHDEDVQASRLVQRLRNNAAHFDRKGRGFDVLFDSPQTRDQVAALATALGLKDLASAARDEEQTRASFILSTRVLATRLMRRMVVVARPGPLETAKEIAAQGRQRIAGTPFGKAVAEAEAAAMGGDFSKLSALNADMKTFLQLLASAQQGGDEPKE